MTRIIAIASSKGGIGKTTTSVNIASRLAHYGKRTLLIDADSQGQAADHLGVAPEKGLYEFFVGDAELTETLVNARENLFLLAGGAQLAKLDLRLAESKFQAESQIMQALEPANEFFDYVIIDCAPSWSVTLINIMVYADEILTPVPLEMLAVGGLLKFLQRIKPIIEATETKLSYVVPTMLDRRLAQSGEIMEQLEANFGALMTQPVRIDVRLSEAAGHGETIWEYATDSRGAQDYDTLTKRIMQDD